ncbi:MAG TPA: methyltransferase domain-containing protein, partial [Ilumatobacteraceae bacterium]|nr:methyltransferase domain-containing protein [Ilumatobacteraceae bacterium]
DNVADDGELRLCGDIVGKRVLELGLGSNPNAVVMATRGAKSIALDPSADRIARLRAAAEAAEVKVECHQGELADLGFATSGSMDLVIASQSLDDVDDLPRLLRQVHRVLRTGAPFVVAMRHPVAAMFDDGDSTARRPYGADGVTFSELYMAFERTNFHFDAMYELQARQARDAVAPTVLVLRARKQGN